jgi:hypothetical protein
MSFEVLLKPPSLLVSLFEIGVKDLSVEDDKMSVSAIKAVPGVTT